MMSWASVKLIPGLNVQMTPTLRQAGYSDMDKGRFRDGLFQKLGGWSLYYSGSVGDTVRYMHVYQDLDADDRVTLGGEASLQDLTSGVLLNISPQQETTSVTADFSTTATSATVTIVDASIGVMTTFNSVTFLLPVAVGGLILQGTYQIASYVSGTSYTITADSVATGTVNNGGAVPTLTTVSGSSAVTVGLTAHGLSVGDEVIFGLSETIGGVTISGRYTVQTVPSADTFTITASYTASSSAGPTGMNSSEASFLYHLTLGPQALGSAYGAGAYGSGTYGFGATLNAASGSDIAAADWSLDNWGELLIACPEGGGVYWWGQGSGFQNTQLISGAPIYNTGAFVSIAEQVVVAFGSTTEAAIGSYHDPLLVRWCETGDFFTWSALATYRIPTGSKCVGGCASPGRNLIWTDIDLWAMDYIGATLGYGFNKLGANCGLIAKHAHAQYAGNVYWMGKSNFYSLTGAGVSIIPCTVWDLVFHDLDDDYKHLCVAGSDTAFSEVWFFYPSNAGSYGYCDKYVKYNVNEGVWDAGTLQRNAWVNRSVLPNPIAITDGGFIYSHESGHDAGDSAINPFFETGYFTINEGEDFVFIDRIYPDFKWGEYGDAQTAQIQITIKVADFAGETPVEYGPYTVSQASQHISKRVRGRYIALRVESADAGSFWRLGDVKFRYAPDGRR
jgi:hypothetical protein